MSYFNYQYGSAIGAPGKQISELQVRNIKETPSTTNRKGIIIRKARLPKIVRERIAILEQTNGIAQEIRRYGNGSIGVFLENGKFRFISGGNNLIPRKKGSKMKFRTISQLAAKRALTRYYKNKSYKNDGARKAALKRDLCSTNKPVITDSRYLRPNGPANYDYPGVDDGSTCPPGHKIHRKHRVSAKKKKELLKRLKKNTVEAPVTQKGGSNRILRYADNAANRKLGRVGKEYVRNASRNKNQIGGTKSKVENPNLLKAVKLLREYYNKKYNNHS